MGEEEYEEKRRGEERRREKENERIGEKECEYIKEERRRRYTKIRYSLPNSPMA